MLRRMRGRENILILTLISDIKMRLIEMFWDLAVYCGSITKFLLSTACALFFTLSINFMVGAVNACREILVEEIGLETSKIRRIQPVALSRPILFTLHLEIVAAPLHGATREKSVNTEPLLPSP